jgi:5'-3' exonuclease
MDRVLLLDTNNYVWLGNITFKPKKVVSGYENTSMEAPQEGRPEDPVIFNFFRNFRSLIETFAPHKVIACLEGHPTFRYDLLPEYKANRIIKTGAQEDKRSETKQKFDGALPEVIRLIKHLPITTMRHPHYEADDLLAALAEDLKDEDVIVVSNDSDLIQLLQKGYRNFRLYAPSKKAMQTAPPHHYLTWKCLAGDKSDNIPRILGPKTAEKTVADPALLKAFLAKTEENAARFRTNKLLIELASVPLDQVEVNSGVADYDSLRIEFEQMNFQSLIKPSYWEKFVRTFSTIRF